MTDASTAGGRSRVTITVELSTVAERVRAAGIALIVLAMATSPLTFNWIVEHDPALNFFPEFSGRVIYLSDVLLAAGVVVWLSGRQLSPAARPVTLGPSYVAIPLVTIVVLTALSTVWARESGVAGYSAVRRLLLLAAYVALVNDGSRRVLLVAALLHAVALLQLVVSWAQVLSGALLGLELLGEVPDNPSTGCPRPPGLSFNPNPLGLYFGVASAAAYGVFLVSEGPRPKTVGALAAFVATLFGLLLTMSRAPLLALALASIVVSAAAWIWNRRERRRTLARFAIAAVFAFAALRALPVLAPTAPHCAPRGNRLSFSVGAFSATAFQRIEDFRMSEPIIRQHMWLGVGAGNYALTLAQRMPPMPHGLRYTPVHNVALLMWAELGLLGLAAWLALSAAPLVWLAARLRAGRLEPGEIRWLPALLVLLAVTLLEFTPWATQDGRVLLMGMLGLWAGGVRAARTPSLTDP